MAEETRTVTLGDRSETYHPSSTELLFEALCQHFGASLDNAKLQMQGMPADTNLTRLTKAVTIEHPHGSTQVVQFQYQRTPPFRSPRALQVYNRNRATKRGRRRARDLSESAFEQEIGRHYVGVDGMLQVVTDPHHVRELSVHRWPKDMYIAVYDLKTQDAGLEQALRPFPIENPRTIFNEEYTGSPRLHIHWRREPFFVMQGCVREDTTNLYDELVFSFPQVLADHAESALAASRRQPMERYAMPMSVASVPYAAYPMVAEARYQLHSLLPPEMVMGWLESYLDMACRQERFS